MISIDKQQLELRREVRDLRHKISLTRSYLKKIVKHNEKILKTDNTINRILEVIIWIDLIILLICASINDKRFVNKIIGIKGDDFFLVSVKGRRLILCEPKEILNDE